MAVHVPRTQVLLVAKTGGSFWFAYHQPSFNQRETLSQRNKTKIGETGYPCFPMTSTHAHVHKSHTHTQKIRCNTVVHHWVRHEDERESENNKVNGLIIEANKAVHDNQKL